MLVPDIGPDLRPAARAVPRRRDAEAVSGRLLLAVFVIAAVFTTLGGAAFGGHTAGLRILLAAVLRPVVSQLWPLVFPWLRILGL